MPYRVRWEGHGVYRRFYGAVSADDVKNACDEIAADPRYEDIRYVLSDFLEASPTLTDQEAHSLAQLERSRFFNSPDVVNAVVAGEPSVVECVPYLGAADQAPCPIALFDDVSDARHWIAANPRLAWFGRSSVADAGLTHN